MKASEQYYSLIIVSEPQNNVHYAMPIRMMEYVTMEYRKQLQELENNNKKAGKLSTNTEFLSGIRKEDKITPVVAIVLYCDSNHEWDGSCSLHEVIEWGADPEFEEDIKGYIPDFKINIAHVGNIGETKKFKTSLQHILEMIKYSKDKNKLKQFISSNKENLDKMDNVEVTAAFALLGQSKIVEKLLLDEKDEREGFGMCIALDEMMKDHEEIGEKRGIERGIEGLNELIQKLLSMGRTEDLLRSTTDLEFQKTLFAEAGIKLN